MRIAGKISWVVLILLLFFTLCFQAGATTYYVCDTEADCDGGAAGNTDWETGNDSNSSAQAQNRGTPWKTIQKAESVMTAGDKVIIGDGTYTEYGTANYIAYISGSSGTSSGYIKYVAENLHGAVLDGANSCTYGIMFVDSDWIWLEGLDIRRTNANAIYMNKVSNSCTHIYIKNCIIREIGNARTDTNCVGTVTITGIASRTVNDYTTVDGCEFWGITPSLRAPCCTIDYSNHHAVYTVGKHWLIKNCIFYGVIGGWGIKVDGHDNSMSGSTHIIANNTFANSNVGISSGCSMSAYGQIVLRKDHGRFFGHDIILQNNALYDPPVGGVWDSASRIVANFPLTDSIFFNNTTNVGELYECRSGGSNVTCTYTPTTSNNTVDLGLAGFGFTNAGSNDYTLTGSSALIDAGRYLTHVDYVSSGSDSGTSIVVDQANFFLGPIATDAETAMEVTFYDATNGLQHRSVTAISGDTLTIDSSVDYIYDAANQTDATKNTQVSYEHSGVRPDVGSHQYGGPPQNEDPYCSVVNGDESIYADVASTITAACTAIDPDGENSNITYLWTFVNGAITAPGVVTDEDPGTVTFTCSAYPCTHSCSLVITDELDLSATYNFTITHIENSPPVSSNDTTFLWGFDSNSDTLGPCDYSESDIIGEDTGHAVVYNSSVKKLGSHSLEIDGSGAGDTYISFDDDAEDIWGGATIPDFALGFWFKSKSWVDDTYIIYGFQDVDNMIRVKTASSDEMLVYYEQGGGDVSWATSGCSLNDGNWWYIMPYADSATDVQGIRVYNEAGALQGCSNTAEVNAIDAITINSDFRFHIGQTISGAGDYYLDALRISTDFSDNFVTDGSYLADCYETMELESIGTTDQSGTYGIDDYLAVPFTFSAPTTLDDGVNETIESYATCETGDDDLKLAFSTADSALTTHWLTTTATEGYKIIAGMNSADLTVSSITIGGDDSIDSTTTIPTGENLDDNADVLIDASATSLSTAVIALCDSDGTAIATNTTNSTAGDTVYASLTLAGSEVGYYNEGPINDLGLTLDLDIGSLTLLYAGTQPSGWGVGTNEWLFEGTLAAGDRDGGSELLLSGSAMTRTLGTKIIDDGGNELSDYDWPSTDILADNTWRVYIAGTIFIGATGDIAKISSIGQQVNTDIYRYMGPITDDVELTGDNITIQGYGSSVANTGTLTFSGNNCLVTRVKFSGAVTGAESNGNIYHPVVGRRWWWGHTIEDVWWMDTGVQP